MFVGACADAWPQYCDAVLQDVRKSGFPAELGLAFEPVSVNGFTAQHFSVEGPAKDTRPSGLYSDIVRRLGNSHLPQGVKAHALGIFEIMGKAEALVHGKKLADVHFHELADWDSLADIVAAASFIDKINIKHWASGALPLGGGKIKAEHGMIAVPAPAVLAILEGFDWVDDGIGGERVTPTGAAILRYLVEPVSRPMSGRLLTSGSGAGTKRFAELANLTRIVVFETSREVNDQTISQLAFEIDDMTPEELAVSLDHIRAVDGVLDASYGIQYAKKGRIQFTVRILNLPDCTNEVLRACFDETTTLGVRKTLVSRTVLARESVEVDLASKSLPVKIVHRPNKAVTAKTESDAVAHVPTLQARRSQRLAAEEAALKILKGAKQDGT
jgi:uncharacterized protein (TIGR00299 family) protein